MAEKNPIISYEPNKPLLRNSPNVYNKLQEVMNKYSLRPLHCHRGNIPTEENRRELNLEKQITRPGIIYKVKGKYSNVQKYCVENFLPPPQIQNLK